MIKQNKLDAENASTKNSNLGTAQTGECNLNTDGKAGSLSNSRSGLPTTSSLLDLPKMLGNDGVDDDSR